MSQLSLEFTASQEGKTYLDKQYASYPFHVCRTQYFENDPPGMANIYIQSASGGIYENERLSTNVIANSNSFSHVTTQASTIVHGMTSGNADQSVAINATNNSYTEYISDPLILFPQSNLSSTIDVYADDTSTAVIADSFLLHFLNGNEHTFNQLNSTLQIFTENNELLAKDVYQINPYNFINKSHNYIGMGTVCIVNRNTNHQKLLELLRNNLQQNKDIYGGVSMLPNQSGMIMKFLVSDGDTLKKTIQQTWTDIRKSIVGITPNVRKK